MTFPRYPRYKDSGVVWLGEVPAHWEVLPLKSRFRVVGGSTPTAEEEHWGGQVTWVTPGDLSALPSLDVDASARQITDKGLASCGATLVPPRSLILSTRAPIGSLAIASVPLCTNQGCKSLIPQKGIESRFFAYLLRNSTEALNVRGKGTTFLELSGDELASFKVSVPPPDEQMIVARFLDHETGQVDALIEEQRRLIELLKEKRQAVISHAVTKGLDPNVPMKDSGVEWLGEVPAHWDVVSLSRVLSSIDQGWSPTAEAFPASAGDWGVIKLSAIRTGQFVEGNNKKLPDDVVPDSEIEIQAGDLLVTRANTPELVGDACVVRNEPEARLIFSDLVYRLRISGNMTSRFLCYVLLSDVGRAQLQADARGSSMSMAKISHGHIKSCLIPLPPVEEQNRISSRIDQELAAISTLTSAVEQSIGFLTERRSALISAAVTGKIDVRGWSAGAETEEPELAMVAEDSAGYSAQGGAQ